MSSTSFISQEMLEQAVVCRFCAQTKSNNEILCFSTSEDVLNNCLTILEYFKIDFIHLTNTDNLPKSICEPCYTLMQNSYSFFKMVQQTQTELSSIYLDDIKIEYPDDEVKTEKCIESEPVQTHSEPLQIDSEPLQTDSEPVQTDSEPKVCEEIADTLYTIFETPNKLHDVDINNDLNVEEEELPDYNSDTGLSEDNRSWNCYSWKCAHCTSTFTSIPLLRSHSTVTHRTCNAFTCNDCTETYESFDEFIEHVQNHKENLRYFCRYCNCQNLTIKDCITHERYHIENYQRCDLCGELIENTKLLSEHRSKFKQLDHFSDDSLSSYDFDDSFVIPPSNHKIESWKDYPWICRFCNIAFNNLDTWRSHIKKEHKKCVAYKCFDCDAYRTRHIRYFISHIQHHRENLSLLCYICNVRKKNAKALIRHINSHNYDTISCEFCDEKFTDNDALDLHTKTYYQRKIVVGRKRQLTKEELTCKLCNTVLKSRKHLHNHKRMHKLEQQHSQEYPCDKCGKLFKTKGALQCHYATYDKKFQCDHCGRFFANKSLVRGHLRSLNAEKRFKCETCGFKCKNSYRLKQHKLCHSTNTPFVCDICNKAFKRKTYMQRHKLQHTGEKPYACKFCDKTFTNSGNRDKHMKRIHAQLRPREKRPID